MTTETVLSECQAYPWHKQSGAAFRGFLFTPSGKYLEGPDGLQWAKNNINLLNNPQEACHIDGCWSAIVDVADGVLLLSDRMGFFPLFYGRSAGRWVVGDQPEALAKKMSGISPNTRAFSEFRLGGFVMGNETLVQGIFRLKPGDSLRLSDNGEEMAKTLHYFLPEAFDTEDVASLSSQLEGLLYQSTEKLIGSAKGKTLVVPLSGGYDSRLIAALLKKAGHQDVVCLTYGKPNAESHLSRETARRLGYRWIFSDYRKIANTPFLDDPEFNQYVSQSGLFSSMPYLQEYFAVKELKNNQLIPEDSIFLPGHSGDYLGGSYVEKTARFSGSMETLYAHLLNWYFGFRFPDNGDSANITQRLRQWFEAYKPEEKPQYPNYHAWIEDWDVKEKLSKFVFHSAGVFPIHGYGVRFPLWDVRLIRLFRNMPYELRKNKWLYDQVLEQRIFKPMNIYYGSKELKAPLPNIKRHLIKQSLKKYLPDAMIRARLKKQDYLCYAEFTKAMEARIKQNRISPSGKIRSYNAIICDWYLQKALKSI